MCYNKSMRILVRFFITCLCLIQLQANAVTFNVLTLPADLYNQHENYFGFLEPSEVIANDVITYFNNTNGKIISPDLYAVRAKLTQNTQLKASIDSALRKFHTSKYIDYKTFKDAAKEFNAKSVLLIRTYTTSSDNSLKRSIWDVLDITSYFRLSHDFYLNTNIVLLDTVNDLPMWQNTYVKKLSNNEGFFIANNYAQARTEFEKLKSYSKHIAAADAAQNIVLRFFPKVVSPIETKPVKIEENGGTLRYNSSIPEISKPKEKESEIMDYGEMLLDY